MSNSSVSSADSVWFKINPYNLGDIDLPDYSPLSVDILMFKTFPRFRHEWTVVLQVHLWMIVLIFLFSCASNYCRFLKCDGKQGARGGARSVLVETFGAGILSVWRPVGLRELCPHVRKRRSACLLWGVHPEWSRRFSPLPGPLTHCLSPAPFIDPCNGPPQCHICTDCHPANSPAEIPSIVFSKIIDGHNWQWKVVVCTFRWVCIGSSFSNPLPTLRRKLLG